MVEGHPPRVRPPTSPAARSPHRECKPRGQCWAPTPAHPRPQHGASGPRQPARRAGSRGRDSASPQTPLTMAKGNPPGDALRPPSQRTTPARKRASCGAAAGSHAGTDRTRDTRVAEPRLPAPEDGQPGEGQRLMPKAPQNGGRPPPHGDGPPPPQRHAAPTGHASQGDTAGPPQPHSHLHSTWVVDPDSPPGGRAAGGGGAPDLRRPS